jgi:acetyl esterase/lipase
MDTEEEVMKTRWLLPAALLLAITGCGELTGGAEGEVTYAEVPSPSEPGGVHPLTLDIAVPEGPGPFPAIVFIHGGGWVIGDLDENGERVQEASRRGFVGVTINYRLANLDDGHGKALHPWPAQLQDVRCALRWLAANAATYKVDTARVGVLGGSAGGHLAMMSAYARNEARFEPDYCPYSENLEVKAVVSMCGAGDPASVYETTDWWIKPYVTRFLALPDGAKVRDAPEVFADVSNLTYMGHGPRVPLLILQGTADTLVLPEVQRAFAVSAQLLGQEVHIESLEGAGHDIDATHRAESDELIWKWFGERL